MSEITIFSCPKPFTTASLRRIQENALGSWKELGRDVKVLLAGSEDGTAEAAAHYGWPHLQEIRRSCFGTPLVSSLFAQARLRSETPLLAYVNADLILTREFVETALRVSKLKETFLIVGQRWNLALEEPLWFSLGWEAKLKKEIFLRGRLHAPNGSDYFIFPKECFPVVPDFAVGRSGWDNWMIYHARKERYAVVDASASILAVHQDHDYSHLPGGLSHHRLPESRRNVVLAGGRQRIFFLGDADYIFQDGQLRQRPLRWNRLGREVEVWAVLQSNSLLWQTAVHALFHPWKALREWRASSFSPNKKYGDLS